MKTSWNKEILKWQVIFKENFSQKVESVNKMYLFKIKELYITWYVQLKRKLEIVFQENTKLFFESPMSPNLRTLQISTGPSQYLRFLKMDNLALSFLESTGWLSRYRRIGKIVPRFWVKLQDFDWLEHFFPYLGVEERIEP